MNNTIRVIFAAVIGMVTMTALAWTSGNENYYRHEHETKVSPSSIGKEPEADREYFYETVVIENVYPSSIPLVFESRYDTLSSTLMSRKID